MDSGFRRKDGRGGGIYANLRANGRRGMGRGFRLSPERRGWRRRGGDVDSGFHRKDGGGGVYADSWADGRRGGDVDSGFRRKDGGGGVGEGTWIPAFAGKTGVAASGRGRGFRLSPERRGWAIREGTWIRAFAGKTEGVAALRFSPARCFVVLYRSRELRPQRFVHMGHTEHCLFVEGPSRNLKPDGQAFGV